MPSYVLRAAVGDVDLGTVCQNPQTRRWEVWFEDRCYSFRDAEDATVALHMLHEQRGDRRDH
jgi:hypothetical protein